MKSDEPRKRINVSVVVLLLFGVVQVMEGIYFAKDQSPSADYRLLYFIAFLWGTGWWISADNRRHRVDWVFDMGLLLYVAWPLVMPFYLIKTRGVKAYVPIGAFIITYVSGTLVGYLIGSVLIP